MPKLLTTSLLVSFDDLNSLISSLNLQMETNVAGFDTAANRELLEEMRNEREQLYKLFQESLHEG